MPSSRTLDIQPLSGDAVRARLDDVAALRIAVFRDWPYLYDGDMNYERDYLSTYAASPASVFVLACDGDRVVGASTGIPLADDADAFARPFVEAGRDPGQVFYFGESVLLPEYRGRGIGHAFFDHREAHARRLGRFGWIAFAAVERDEADPRRPREHRGNEVFWRKRGYAPEPALCMRLGWREVGGGADGKGGGETDHLLRFWLRALEAA